MYNKIGNYPLIPAADLINLQSPANTKGVGNSRIGSSPYVLGKRGGMVAIRDAGSSVYAFVFATGDKTSDAWETVDGATTYTPLNIGAFTNGADTTYADGLLTTDGGNDAAGRTTQTITSLQAGKYYVSGTYAAEGSASDYVTPRLKITGATDGNYYNRALGKAAIHATAAESANPKADFGFEITLTVAQDVVITLDIVDEANVLAAGSAFITLNPLESVN